MRISILLLVAYLTLPHNNCFSQSQLDSLINKFHNESNPDTRIALSREIGILTYTRNPDICKSIIFEAIRDSNRITDKILLGKNLNILGIVYQYQAKYDSSDIFLNQFLRIATEAENQELISSAYNNLAINYKNRSDFETSIRYFIEALKGYEMLGLDESSAAVLNDIGNTYIYMKNYEMALGYLNKTIDLLKQQESLRALSILANTHNSIGYIFRSLNNKDSAFFYYNKSLAMKEKVGNLYSWSNTKNNICSLLRDKPNDCMECYRELLSVQELIKDNAGIVRTKINLAVVYSDTKQYQQSVDQYKEIIDSYSEYCDFTMLSDLYKNIADAYSKLGFYKKAYEHRILYDKYQDSLRNHQVSKEIMNITEQYETEKKEHKIAMQKVEISEAKFKISNRNRLIFGLGGGAVAIVFFSLFIIQRNKRKAQQEKDKAIIEEQEKGLVAIINAQEEERKRVAKDLHDGVGQQISAISLNFQALAKRIDEISTNLNHDITKIKNMIQEAGTDIRAVSHQMMPRALTEFGLVDALDDMIDKSFSNSSIECHFEHRNMEERLPHNIEIGLYRIAQELLNNIIKHSNANIAHVQLVRDKTHCTLTVHDNGKGIPSTKPEGIGILNMNSRINALKGEFNLESELGSGTTATVKVRVA
jgi:signal transduction histidine kinase